MNQNDIFKNESYFLLIIDQNTPEVDVMVMFPTVTLSGPGSKY